MKIFTKNGENLIYWNEERLQMKVYTKRSILRVKTEDIEEMEENEESIRRCPPFPISSVSICYQG